jgi:hypothetical protein
MSRLPAVVGSRLKLRLMLEAGLDPASEMPAQSRRPPNVPET